MDPKAVDKKEPVRDVTKPHLRQFFEIKKIGDEPPLNRDGFWKKPEHGFKIKERR
jgi:hypothetical protein